MVTGGVARSAALAHVVPDKVEAAYARSDLRKQDGLWYRVRRHAAASVVTKHS